MPRGSPDGDWTDRLYRILIDCGIHGAQYSALRNATAAVATKKEFDDEIEYLHSKQMIDKYSVPAPEGGPEAIWIRATNKLMFNTGGS